MNALWAATLGFVGGGAMSAGAFGDRDAMLTGLVLLIALLLIERASKELGR